MSSADPVGLRLQRMNLRDQVLVLAQMGESRSEDRGVSAAEVEALFREFGLPPPARVSNDFAAHVASRDMTSTGRRGRYRLTPVGRHAIDHLIADLDMSSLVAESAEYAGTQLGHARHTLVPPSLAPPELVAPLSRFLDAHPFDNNVFGMTRFADSSEDSADPVAHTLATARTVCASHGLEFHLASDRAIHDDLWTNVTAHMWASRYGIGLFEDLADRGLNYNLLIEVGGMLTTGRRCALLKDGSISRMPTDLVGHIYKSVDLQDQAQVADILHGWIRDDLGIGPCRSCP